MYSKPIQFQVVENAVFAFTQPPPLWRHIMITLVIVITSVIVSMATDCLGIVLELNVSMGHFLLDLQFIFILQGVMAAAPLAYIFPAACVMKLQNDRLLCTKNIPRIIVASFGILVAVAGVAVVIMRIVSGVTCNHGKEPAYCAHWPHIGPYNSSMLTTVAPT
jgi:sodium-coupled neutral amino acid transporter 11